MRHTRIIDLALLAQLGCVACAQPSAETEVGVSQQALDACSETVPANRNIDGIPAYAQCAASMNSAIFSNNGIDTSLTQMGSDWVRTQYSGGYQCTELAHRYLYFKWQVKWIPNGNAGQWCDTQPPATSGLVQTMTPVHGDIMVLANGSCGADATTGHVNVVDVVDATGAKLTVVEQNGARRGTYMASCAKCFLHVMANNGMASPLATAGSAAPAPSAGAAAPAAGAKAPTMWPQTPPPTTPPIDPGVGGHAAPAVTTPPPPAATTTPVMAPPAATTAAPASAGAPAIAPLTPLNRNPDPASTGGGCSVGLAGGSEHHATAPAWLSLGALALVLRRRRARRNAG